MRYRRAVGGLAALATVISGSALVALAAPSYAGSSTGPAFPVERSGDGVTLLEGADGVVRGLLADDAPVALPQGMTGSPEDAARTHLERFAAKMGIDADTLRPAGASKVAGGEVVRLQQYINGLPVVAGDVTATLDHSGGLEALLGETVSGVVEAPTSLFSDARARVVAREYVADKADVPALGLRVEDQGDWIYNPRLLGAPGPAVNRETQKLHVSSRDGLIDYTIFVDPGFESVALAYSNNHEAVNRKVCDLDNRDVGVPESAACDDVTVAYSRLEGQGPSGIADVDTVYDNLGETAEQYSRLAGLDVSALVGGEDRSLRATTRVCATGYQEGCPLANAFWSDTLQQLVYGDGVTGLDVTAHELAHGVTAHTSQLYYVYQSGAINESMSDVFGNLIDLAVNPEKQGSAEAWFIGEDSRPAAASMPVPLRSMADPTATKSPDRLTSSLWDADPDHQDFGGVHSNSGPGNKAAYLIAQGDRFNGYDVRGLGLDKTFTIYWTAQRILTSGADYKELFHVLPLSCQKNIGKPGTGITEDDCAQVDKAVRATEMHMDAAESAPVAAAYCPAGEQVEASYTQAFDAPPVDWDVDSEGSGLSVADFGFANVNRGADALLLSTTEGEIEETSVTSEPVPVPAGGRLRLDYSTLFGLYAPVDGPTARLEYSTDGLLWLPAQSLAGSRNGGPWSGHSYGWSSARYDLSSLAGHHVRFRISVEGTTGDDNNPSSVLNVDNVKVYTCR
ncbi:M4 family metallopeptidase [Actinopolymorpha sp. B11F2]|uniref:M4 family metallopeptidase n=1 Tax=Actinopolymorpha sp. B11F2 TaxID=3160862 RepID=UPI0032E4BA82